MNNSIYGMTERPVLAHDPEGLLGHHGPLRQRRADLRPLQAGRGRRRHLRGPRHLLPRPDAHRPHREGPHATRASRWWRPSPSVPPISAVRTRSEGPVELLEWIKDRTVNVKAAAVMPARENRRASC
ncbi:MAG: hypothetical protein MZU95_09145 [Desulfomicrobium escambiense]|nr:hypothetical protein [Desulfomicrobium escambiense]